MKNVLTVLLAGGKGTRLEPLTRDRAKPAVPFGGTYRIIDFTLSNCINSDLRKVLVLTQYKAQSLERHLRQGWQFLSRSLDEFIDTLPPQQRVDDSWYRGTADAVYQNIYSIEPHGSEHLLILSGDHIYKMDYSEMLREHMEADADATVACLPVPIDEGDQFGIMQINESREIVQFREKPADPDPIPDDPTRCLASMGIYAFRTDFLLDELVRDGTDIESSHDFGKNLLPQFVDDPGVRVRAFPFRDKNSKDAAYWRDVGTIDAYYDANMDLIAVDPQLNLYDRDWPLRTAQVDLPPPKFVFAEHTSNPPRVGRALDSLVGAGCIISGGYVERSILSSGVRVNSFSSVQDSILYDDVCVGRHAQIRRAIIDKGVDIPAGEKVGLDHEADRERGLTVTESGIVAVPRGFRFS